MKLKFVDGLAVVICFTPLITLLFVQDSLPEKIAIHWNINGEPDGWATRNQVPLFLLSMAGLGLVLYAILRFINRLDPKRRVNETIALKAGIAVITLLAVINIAIIIPSGERFNITSIVFLLVSLLFTFLGNIMYNIKPNYFIGIRLPWTLEDPNNWKLTHRLAGVLWFVGGLVCASLALFITPKIMFPIFITTTMLLVLVPSVYSFVLFRRSKSGIDVQ